MILVLESPLHVVLHQDLLGHRHAGVEDDRADVAVDLARGDPREPLVQPRRVAGQSPTPSSAGRWMRIWWRIEPSVMSRP